MAVARSFPAQNGATRDVEAELARQRAEKRRAAGSLSPVHFTKDLLLGCASVLSSPPVPRLNVACTRNPHPLPDPVRRTQR